MAFINKPDPQGALSFLMQLLESKDQEQKINVVGAKDDFSTLIQLIGGSTDSTKLAGKERYIQEHYKKLKAMDVAYDDPVLGFLADDLAEKYDIRAQQLKAFDTSVNTYLDFQNTPEFDIPKLKEQIQKTINQDRIDNPKNWENKQMSVETTTNIGELITGQKVLETGKFSWNTYDNFQAYMDYAGDSLYDHLNERNNFYDEQLTNFEALGFSMGEDGRPNIPIAFQGKKHSSGKTYHEIYTELNQESNKWFNVLAASKSQVNPSSGDPLIMNEAEFEAAVTMNRGEFFKTQAFKTNLYNDVYNNSFAKISKWETLLAKLQDSDDTEWNQITGAEDQLSGNKNSDVVKLQNLILQEADVQRQAGNAFSVWSGGSLTGEGEFDFGYNASDGNFYEENFLDDEFTDEKGSKKDGTPGVNEEAITDRILFPYVKQQDNEDPKELSERTEYGGTLEGITFGKEHAGADAYYGFDDGDFFNIKPPEKEGGIAKWVMKEKFKPDLNLILQLQNNSYFKDKWILGDEYKTEGKGKDTPIFDNKNNRDEFIDLFEATRSLHFNLLDEEENYLSLKAFHDLLEGERYGLSNLYEDLAKIDWRGDEWGVESNQAGFEVIEGRIKAFMRMSEIKKNRDYLKSEEFKKLPPDKKKKKLRELMNTVQKNKNQNKISVVADPIGNILDYTIFT